MKKMMVMGLALFIGGLIIAGAEDARVLPAKIGRIYTVPTYAFAPGAFDADGSYYAYEAKGTPKQGAIKAVNLGVALEYGIIDWVSFGLQWAPGINVWSDVDMQLPGGSKSTVNANDVYDLVIGGKILIVGDKAPVQNESMRFSVAPGVKIPLPGPKYNRQLNRSFKGKPVTAANMDFHSFAPGLKAYYDYQINENFIINAFGELGFYPIKGALADSGLTGAGVLNTRTLQANIIEQLSAPEYASTLARYGVNAQQLRADINNFTGNISQSDASVSYGFQYAFEVEPIFTTTLPKKVIFTTGIPMKYGFTGKAKYDDVTVTQDFKTYIRDKVTAQNPSSPRYPSMTASAIGNAVSGVLVGQTNKTIKDQLDSSIGWDKQLFVVTPSISFFFLGWFVPVDFKVQYALPVWGQNQFALHSLSLIAKVYFATSMEAANAMR
jgi:hypothetical protein